MALDAAAGLPVLFPGETEKERLGLLEGMKRGARGSAHRIAEREIRHRNLALGRKIGERRSRIMMPEDLDALVQKVAIKTRRALRRTPK